MVERVGLGVVLGLLIASCGPQVFDLRHCVDFHRYGGPGSAPECDMPLYCGDGICDASQENDLSCPMDCPVPVCGDGVCQEGEDLSCPECEHISEPRD